MSERKMTREEFESLKKMIRDVDYEISVIQMRINDLHEINYQLQEFFMNIEDSTQEN